LTLSLDWLSFEFWDLWRVIIAFEFHSLALRRLLKPYDLLLIVGCDFEGSPFLLLFSGLVLFRRGDFALTTYYGIGFCSECVFELVRLSNRSCCDSLLGISEEIYLYEAKNVLCPCFVIFSPSLLTY
jgi:hypothetical protein